MAESSHARSVDLGGRDMHHTFSHAAHSTLQTHSSLALEALGRIYVAQLPHICCTTASYICCTTASYVALHTQPLVFPWLHQSVHCSIHQSHDFSVVVSKQIFLKHLYSLNNLLPRAETFIFDDTMLLK